MDERNDELTFKELWYKYIIPFIKWFCRSIKKTFTSKRLIALVAITVAVPLLVWGISALQNDCQVLSAEKLMRSEAKFRMEVEYANISLPLDASGYPTVSRENYALTVANQQVGKYMDTVKGEQIVKQLYADETIRQKAAAVFIGDASANFRAMYAGEQTTESNEISENYFVWALSNYLFVTNDYYGNFTVTLASNLSRKASDDLYIKSVANYTPSSYETALPAVMKSWPQLSAELMNAVNVVLPAVITNDTTGLKSLMNSTTTVLGDDGVTTEQKDFVKSIVVVSSPVTYTVTSPSSTIITEFKLKDGLTWTFLGFLIGVALFLVIDMIIAAVEGDRRYRGVAAVQTAAAEPEVKAAEEQKTDDKQ